MKRIFLSLAAVSAVSLVGFSGARAADPLPPVPPGGSVAPAPSPSSTTPSTTPSANAGKQGEHGKQLEKLKLELGLSPEQVKKMRPILKSEGEQAKTVRENTSLNEQQKHEKMHQIHAAAFHRFKPILTPAQVAKLKQIRAEHRAGGANT